MPSPAPVAVSVTLAVSTPPSVLPATAATLVLCPSLRSTSSKVIVPAELRLPALTPASSVIAPVATAALMVGASFTPAICTDAVAQLSVPLLSRMA